MSVREERSRVSGRPGFETVASGYAQDRLTFPTTRWFLQVKQQIRQGADFFIDTRRIQIQPARKKQSRFKCIRGLSLG
jgi:hypothetical protein